VASAPPVSAQRAGGRRFYSQIPADRLRADMDDITRQEPPPRVPPVEPELLGSAIFLFTEHLQRVAAETIVDEDDEEEAEEDDEAESPIKMR
jgi:hypothetical protein